MEIWNEKVKANVRWLESELVSNAFQNDVGAIVLLAHAQPHTRRYREFYESLLIVSSQIDKPIMYLHGAEKQFSVERDFSVHNILRVSIAQGGMEDPMEITVDPFGEIPFTIQRRPLLD